jgi:hypothetical protein
MSDEIDNTIEETNQPKKRARKPNPNNKNYFGAEEEQAFQEFLLAPDQYTRDRIFRDKLHFPFTKMIESIIRRYNLFTPYEDFTDTFNDTMSFLTTKASNFKPGKGKKAYSYCGTVCKNYLINKRTNAMKHDNKFISYDTMYTESNPDNRVDDSSYSKTESMNKGLMNTAINDIVDTIEEGFWEDGSAITESEKKVGYAIIEILKNWENIFQLGDTQKFNKTSVFYFIKENTMLSTKEVKDAMKKYRLSYFVAKEEFIKKQ